MLLAKWLSHLFHGPAWLTFLAMGFATGGVALCTYDLFEIFRANFKLITTYGLMAILDGGLLQLVELSFWGYFGLACYLIFKGCVDGLLSRVPRPANIGIEANDEAAEGSPTPSGTLGE